MDTVVKPRYDIVFKH
ncbi:MAG TPA: hypothetical protein LFV92_00020 [Rickettsia endosymbiont of Ceroptres masudai]|nr:hypothetical protein [Rickettsia endosymbiont of Ceroptres masudai]